jgi:hypothetical protein
MCAILGVIAADAESQHARWQARIDVVQEMHDLNRDVRDSQIYAASLYEAVRMLANENGILCEREKAVTEVVMGLEQENLRLSVSLDEAVDRLQEDAEQINELIDSNNRLRYQLEVLERALEAIETAAEAQEEELNV